jgi:hypothetical protein
MAKQILSLRDFSGGASPNEKKWLPHAARLMKNLDPFQDPSYITLSKKPVKVSGDTVTALITWVEDGSPFDTNRYFYDLDGNLYKETDAAVWSVDRAGTTIANGAAGQGLLVCNDYLYDATSTTLGRKGKLSGTPAFTDDFLTDGTTNLDQSGGGTGQTYSTGTSIVETATHRQTFTPGVDPLKAIIINVNTVGTTADWTLTVHDAKDVLIGSKTIANASMGTGNQTFTFAEPLRVIPGNEYHFHVTTSDTTGTPRVVTNVASDLEGGQFSTLFGILVGGVDFHPMMEHLNGVVIGNERYLAYWDEATYEPNRVVLAPGFEVRALAKVDEFVVAAAFRGSSAGEAEEARLYFWDGIADTFNFHKDVSIGAAQALVNSRNRLMGVYGNRGGLHLGTDPFEDISHEIPTLAPGKSVEVYPGAITNYQGQTLIGIAASADDEEELQVGVWAYGRQDNKQAEALTLAFTISTGSSSGENLKVGAVRGIGKELYISFRDGDSYGVDKVSFDSSPAEEGVFESFIFDHQNPRKSKLAEKLIIGFEALRAGEAVTPKVKVNRGDYVAGITVDTEGAVTAELPLFTRFKEIELGFDAEGGVKVTDVFFEFDDLKEERDDG